MKYGRGFIQYNEEIFSVLSAGKETYTVSGISAAVRDWTAGAEHALIKRHTPLLLHYI